MAQHRTTRLDAIFDALAEPTRRAVLERLTLAGATVTELAEPFPMSLQAFLKHVRALEEAGLVRRIRIGRTNHVTIVPEALQAAASWLVARTPLPVPRESQPVAAERQQQLADRARALHAGLAGRMAIVRRALLEPPSRPEEFRPEDAYVRALLVTSRQRPLLVEALRLYDELSLRLVGLEDGGLAVELSELVIPLGRLMFELRPFLPTASAVA